MVLGVRRSQCSLYDCCLEDMASCEAPAERVRPEYAVSVRRQCEGRQQCVEIETADSVTQITCSTFLQRSDYVRILYTCVPGQCMDGPRAASDVITSPPLHSLVVRASTRGAGGQGSIPDRVTPKT